MIDSPVSDGYFQPPMLGGTSRDGRTSIDRAIEVFARGFAFTRSFTYPCEAERIGPLWVIRDRPRTRPADYRREEWVACGIAASKVEDLVRRRSRGQFCICAVVARGDSDGPLRSEYKALGYRLGKTEPFMVHSLAHVPKVNGPFPVQRVTTTHLAGLLAEAARQRMVRAEHLVSDSSLRQYVALENGRPIGWARSIAVGDSSWVSNVYVAPRYRRQGIGKSLLAHVLRDDRANGANQSVLLASHAGSLLYASVGYELIGRLLLYTPKKRV